LEVANGKGGVWGGIFHLLLFFLLANFGRGFLRANSKTQIQNALRFSNNLVTLYC